MSKDQEATRQFDLLKSLRAARDTVMSDLAKVTLALTSTHLWQRVNAVIATPTLLVSALLREKREAAASEVLAVLNLPSREDVLTLSQRLTRIEMVLDDLGAGMDQLRRPITRTQQRTREAASVDVRPSGVLAALAPANQNPLPSKEA